MGELRDKRVKFSKYVPRLIDKAFDWGYEAAIDDVKAISGHMDHSLHYDGLAIDLLLYIDGEYLTLTEDYRGLGEFWESLDPEHELCWGGRFGDGNHFSLKYGGRK